MAGSHKGLNGTRKGKDRESAGSLPLPILCQCEHPRLWKRGHTTAHLAVEFELMQGHLHLYLHGNSILGGLSNRQW